jgi:hypothetical protein
VGVAHDHCLNILNDAEGEPRQRRFEELAGLAQGPFLLKTTTAQDGAPLGGLEGNGGFRSALRADGTRLGTGGAGAGSALGLALLATFRIVLELFIEEKELFASCEDEIVPAVGTFEHFVDEIHPASLAFVPKHPFLQRPTDGAPGSPSIS